jgi:superfamily II DNA helicase RecQ
VCEICQHNVCFIDWVRVRGKKVCEHCTDIPVNPAQYCTVSEVLGDRVQGGGVIDQVQAEDDVQPIFGGHVGQDGEGPVSHHDGDLELGDGVPALVDDSPIEPDQQEDTLLLVLLSMFGHSQFRSKVQEEAVRCVLGREEDVFVSMPTGKTLHL